MLREGISPVPWLSALVSGLASLRLAQLLIMTLMERIKAFSSGVPGEQSLPDSSRIFLVISL